MLLALATTSCSLALDFEDTSDLPCPCDDQHVCQTSKQACVPRASVDDYKACATDTEPPGGDLLCQGTAICQNVNDTGPRCLPTCTPRSYGLPEASAEIASDCVVEGKTCWSTPRGGVCSEGECDSSTPGSCGVGRACEVFNGAGICFTICEIYRFNEEPCAGGQACHPIGNTMTTACLEPGTLQRKEICSLEEKCAAKDGAGRRMICARALADQSSAPRCAAICRPNAGDCVGGQCVQAAAGFDQVNGIPVHICVGEP